MTPYLGRAIIAVILSGLIGCLAGLLLANLEEGLDDDSSKQ